MEVSVMVALFAFSISVVALVLSFIRVAMDGFENKMQLILEQLLSKEISDDRWISCNVERMLRGKAPLLSNSGCRKEDVLLSRYRKLHFNKRVCSYIFISFFVCVVAASLFSIIGSGFSVYEVGGFFQERVDVICENRSPVVKEFPERFSCDIRESYFKQ